MWKITLTLDKASPVEVDTNIGKLSLSIGLGKKSLAVEGIEAKSGEEAKQKATDAANDFLNALSWNLSADLELVPGFWQGESDTPNGPRDLSVHATGRVQVSSRLIARLKRSDGTEIVEYDSAKPGYISVRPSEAAAYFRRGRLSSDPFDRFRNFYLTAENIADRIREQKGLRKLREKKLLRTALAECFAGRPHALRKAAIGILGCSASGCIFSVTAELLYEGHRCQLNHAKASKDKKVPFNPEDERAVADVLSLMELVARELLRYEELHL